MTPDRQRKAAERARKKAAGLVAVTVWVEPQHRASVRVFAAQTADWALSKPFIVLSYQSIGGYWFAYKSDASATGRGKSQVAALDDMQEREGHASDHPSDTVAG